MDPDAVIVAVGGEPVSPPIPGIDGPNVMFAEDALHHPDQAGNRVVIIGGGLVGCETAIVLGEKGHNVHVVEFTEYLMGTAQFSQRIHTMEFMEKSGATYQTNTRCIEIRPNGVILADHHGESQFMEADTVVLAVGRKPLAALRDSFRDCAFDVINVGDCVKVENIPFAVRSGFDAALRI
jgi:pyruvate/2-oxoglutarate dehydrogenase complex dihydrolipoamide dehydrogenase (E3) component